MKFINDFINDEEGSAFVWIMSIISIWCLALLAAILHSPIADIYYNFADVITVNASSPLHIASDTTGTFLLTLWNNAFGISASLAILIIYQWNNSMRREV